MTDSQRNINKSSRALAFFDIVSEENQTYKCKRCNKNKSGKKKSNLVSHLQTCHKDIYDEHILNTDPIAAEDMQIKLLQCMVEKVTLNGRPFASLNDSGYVKSIEDKLEVLTKAGFEIKLRDKKYLQIKKYISDTANKITQKIKAEANDRHISLMLDIASKNHKSILGINLRYIIDDTIKERCIGMIELTERHTSLNLAIEVKRCIDKFGITLKQINSITTDNAGNVVGIVDYLDEETLHATEEEQEEGLLPKICEATELNRSQTIDEPVSEDEIHELAQQIMEEEALEAYLDDSDEYEDLLKKVIDNFPHHINKNTANVRCGAHTVHLIVRGAIKKSNFNELVTLCRKVAKSLRKEAFVREARQRDLQYILPHLNVETRWDSDYTMVIAYRFVC